MPSLNSDPHSSNYAPISSYGTIDFINPTASASSFLTGRYSFTSCWAAVFLTINACIGAGLLNVPQVFDESGSILISFIIKAVSTTELHHSMKRASLSDTSVTFTDTPSVYYRISIHTQLLCRY